MNRSLSWTRPALWAALAAAALHPTVVLADQEALSGATKLFWEKALLAQPKVESTKDLALERVVPPEEQGALLRLKIQNFQEGTNATPLRVRLFRGEFGMHALDLLRSERDTGIAEWRTLYLDGDPLAPQWMVDLYAREVEKMSVPRQAPKNSTKATPRGRQELTWGTQRNESQSSAIAAAPQALAFAGPAVKDGVASYRKTADGMVVRIPFATSLEELDAWIAARGLGLALSLRRDAIMPIAQGWVVEGRTAVPAWVVSPAGLHAATITAFSFGGQGSCDNSNWLELKLDDDKSPAIWAVLLLHSADMAKEVSVSRVPSAKPGEGSYESFRSELEVRWPSNWLQPLRLTAKRFDATFTSYEEKADGSNGTPSIEVIGSAWKVEVRAQPDGKPLVTQQYSDGYVYPLSTNGTPQCAPK